MPPTRRNLFQSHLSRRPASNPPQPSTSDANNHPSTTADNHNHHDNNNNIQNTNHQSGPITPQSTTIPTASAQTDNGDIIARDKNGKFQIDNPVLPPIPLDESDEEDDVEDEDEGAMEGIEEDGRPSGGSESKDKDSEFIPFKLSLLG